MPSRVPRADFILSACLVGQMQVENFDVPVGVVLPELDGVSAADVDVNAAIGMVGFGVIGKLLRIIAYGTRTCFAEAVAPGGRGLRETQ